MHATKGHIKPEYVRQILAVTTKEGKHHDAKQKAGQETLHGLPLKWCLIEGCSHVPLCIKSHLTHCHRVKLGVLLPKYCKVGNSYQGKIEV